ncbi:MAG: hypothetical protein F6K55_03850 [Moorea sp. SIO4A3]|nr:hypothetical protein [Moorena sp. SIO4A3]
MTDQSFSVMTSRKSNEHYTPASVLEPVYEFFGKVDLDPCSNSLTHPNVHCQQAYTIEKDGLSQRWEATNAFINPPFSDTSKWVCKAILEHETTGIEILFLAKAAVDTRWGQLLLDYPHCHWTERVKFIKKGNKDRPAPFPSTLYYLGKDWRKFTRIFSQYGVVQPGTLLFQRLIRLEKTSFFR